MVALPQPRSLPRTRANTSAKRLTEKVTKPTQSIRRWRGSFDSTILAHRDEDGHDADGHVDEEDPAPTDAARDGAADQRTDGDGPADDGTVDAEGGPSVPSRERAGDQGQGRGEHDGPTTPCTARARFNMSGRVDRPQMSEASEKTTESDGEHVTSPVDVAEHPGGEEERRQRQRVCVDDPLEVREAGVQRPLDIGQRHVHDGDVEKEHERRRADGDQCPPFAVECGHWGSVSSGCSRSYTVA